MIHLFISVKKNKQIFYLIKFTCLHLTVIFFIIHIIFEEFENIFYCLGKILSIRLKTKQTSANDFKAKYYLYVLILSVKIEIEIKSLLCFMVNTKINKQSKILKKQQQHLVSFLTIK